MASKDFRIPIPISINQYKANQKIIFHYNTPTINDQIN